MAYLGGVVSDGSIAWRFNSDPSSDTDHDATLAELRAITGKQPAAVTRGERTQYRAHLDDTDAAGMFVSAWCLGDVGKGKRKGIGRDGKGKAVDVEGQSSPSPSWRTSPYQHVTLLLI